MENSTVIIYCIITMLLISSIFVLIAYYSSINISKRSQSIYVPLSISESSSPSPDIENQGLEKQKNDENDKNELTNNEKQINQINTIILEKQGVESNSRDITERCERSIDNLLDYNKSNNDKILFMDMIRNNNSNINEKDIAYTWLMCNAQILCKPLPDLRCDVLSSLLGRKQTMDMDQGVGGGGSMYQLEDNYNGGGLYDKFVFPEGFDPMYGMNKNVTKLEALQLGLFTYNDTIKYNHPHKQCVIKVSEKPYGSVRFTVKMESEKSYNGGLFVLDIDHMPSGLSVWPIFSLTGKNWPCDGEMRILQTVSSVDWTTSQNFTSLHTEQICTQDSVPGITNNGMCGTGRQYDGNRICRPCDRRNGNDCPYDGCGVFFERGTAGYSFNEQGGGVFACEWIYDGVIRIWVIPRSRVSEYVPFYADKIDISKWPQPNVEFKSCPGSFKNSHITFSTTLCGDRGEEYFTNKKTAGSCASYVVHPGSDFSNAKWIINYLKVFQKIIK
jgi:hypothetical protein